MDEDTRELDQLRHQLDEITRNIREGHAKYNRWRFGYRSLNIRATVSSMSVIWVYVSFNIACFAIGAVLIILDTTITTSLGVALVVGAMFAFGTFVSQFWVIVYQRGRELDDYVFGDRKIELRRLHEEWVALTARINDLEAQRSDGPANADDGS